MSTKSFCFTYGRNAVLHVKAVNKFIAKVKVDTFFGPLWNHSYYEDSIEY